MTRYEATVQVTVHDEAALMLYTLTGIELRTDLYGGPIPSASAEINLSVEGDDSTDAVAQALHEAASLTDESARWTR